MRTYEPEIGMHITMACEAAVNLANQHSEPVEFNFNDTPICVVPGEDPKAVSDRVAKVWQAKFEAYQSSPEGKAAAARDEEHRRIADEAEKAGIVPFAIADQQLWDECVANNSDGYGSGVIRYAARWAAAMEKRIEAGESLADVAKEESHSSDLEGITGFMYGCAVGILAKVWKYGEELRRWHNLDSQLRDEGEKANESGGVLNPALFTIG